MDELLRMMDDLFDLGLEDADRFYREEIEDKPYFDELEESDEEDENDDLFYDPNDFDPCRDDLFDDDELFD